MHTIALILLAPGITLLGLLTLATVLVVRADATRSRHLSGRPITAWGRFLVRLDNAALDGAHMLRTRSLRRRSSQTVSEIWMGA